MVRRGRAVRLCTTIKGKVNETVRPEERHAMQNACEG